MNVFDQLQWFAIQTNARCESGAAAALARTDVEVFLPRMSRRRARGRRVLRPLFPGYVFGRFRPLEQLSRVRTTRNVLRVVGSRRYPSPIADEVIGGLRAEHEAHGFIELKEEPLLPGDRVAVQEGAFRGLLGRVLREPDEKRRVTILLECLQSAAVVMEVASLSRAVATP